MGDDGKRPDLPRDALAQILKARKSHAAGLRDQDVSSKDRSASQAAGPSDRSHQQQKQVHVQAKVDEERVRLDHSHNPAVPNMSRRSVFEYHNFEQGAQAHAYVSSNGKQGAINADGYNQIVQFVKRGKVSKKPGSGSSGSHQSKK